MLSCVRGVLIRTHSTRDNTHALSHLPRRRSRTSSSMKIAVEGCCHGELDMIYKEIEDLEHKNKYKVDLLLICGDFQAVRNYRDLQCMAVPDKYKKLQGFHKYYSGEKRAPILTVIIGGNHEASNYFWELYHGGWVATNIYFLGHAGCVQVNGIRIAGASGIFKPYSFNCGNYETIPYSDSALRSVYHIREYSVRRLSLLTSPQVFLSHDWPLGIEQYGNLDALLKIKPFWKNEIAEGTLGSPPLMGLLQTLQPMWWFAAHMHVRFKATVEHPPPPITKVANPDEIAIDEDEDAPAPLRNNPDEIMLDDEEMDVTSPLPLPARKAETTFIALDKCLPKRKFLEVVDIDTPESFVHGHDPVFTFDPEWLAVNRAFAPWLTKTKQQRFFPDEYTARSMVEKEYQWVLSHLGEKKEISSVQQFVRTAPVPGGEGKDKLRQPQMYPNPQTRAYCKMLGIEDRINPPEASHKTSGSPRR